VTRPELEDERAFLLRSLDDLDREHQAGDLSDEDHEALRDDYVARAAALLRAGDAAAAMTATTAAASDTGPTRATGPTTAAGTGGRRPRRRRRWLMAGVAALVAGGAIWALVAHLGSRLPGETVTGSVSLSPAEQTARTLAQAQTLEGQGDAAGAVQLYETVLRQHPDQEEALAEVGWLEYEAGAQAKKGTLLVLGAQEERKAESVSPGAFAPHLYLGSMLLTQGHPQEAVAEYRLFLADHPPRATVRNAVPFLTKAFSEAHQALPALPLGKAPSG